jgi:multiple sugar transport system substrate-binding protein
VLSLKKILSLLVMLSLVFTIVACNGNEKSSGKKDAEKKEEVTIKYTNWNLGTEEENNLERQMIAAFEEKYPHINIEIDDSIDTKKYVESLAAAASADSMPDVFMLSQVAQAVANDWVLDVNDLVADDEDYAKIADVVTESVTYSGKTRALPVAQHFFGYFVNKDLFNKANLDYPELGMTLDEFQNAIKSTTDVNAGVIGVLNPFSIPDWYPAAVSDSLGWFTYNEGKYDLDSKEFINGIKLTETLIQNNYSFETLSDEQKANFNGENPHDTWVQGGVALKFDGSWALGGFSDTLDFEWDFAGVPGGRTFLTNDFMGISSTTEHPEEAYTFVKWMSFGKEGFLKRIELADKAGTFVSSLPIINDQEVLDAYFERLEVPGIRLAFENLDNAVIEPFKTTPGYVESRWQAPTGVAIGDNANATIGNIIDSAIRGQVKYEDYAKQVNELANKKYEEANAQINK